MGSRPAALALSPNALALAALGPGPGGAGCALCVALLPDSACVRRPDGAAGGDAPSCEDVLGARHAPSLCLCHGRRRRQRVLTSRGRMRACRWVCVALRVRCCAGLRLLGFLQGWPPGATSICVPAWPVQNSLDTNARYD